MSENATTLTPAVENGLVRDYTPTGTSAQPESPSALEREGLVRKALED